MRKIVADYPKLVAEWHPTLNGDLKPEDFSYGSRKKIWWQCSINKDHIWEASCNNRTKDKHPRNCPYCSNKKVNLTNCLSTTHPEIAKQWHPTKNGNLTPFDVVAGSHKKAWFQCHRQLDHEWKTTISAIVVNYQKRNGNGNGCPCCVRQKVVLSNCLATTHPEIAKQWHPTKNGNLTPFDVVAGSHKKAWFQCKRGHEWKTSCNSRTNSGSGCPICNESRGEIKIRNYLISKNKNVKSQHKIKGIGIFDFITYHKQLIAIEYHGKQHYFPTGFGCRDKTKILNNFCDNMKRDYCKIKYCKSKNIPLLIIPYWDFDRIDQILDDFFADKLLTFSEPVKEVKNKELMRKKIRDKLNLGKEILCGLI